MSAFAVGVSVRLRLASWKSASRRIPASVSASYILAHRALARSHEARRLSIPPAGTWYLTGRLARSQAASCEGTSCAPGHRRARVVLRASGSLLARPLAVSETRFLAQSGSVLGMAAHLPLASVLRTISRAPRSAVSTRHLARSVPHVEPRVSLCGVSRVAYHVLPPSVSRSLS